MPCVLITPRQQLSAAPSSPKCVLTNGVSTCLAWVPLVESLYICMV